MKGTGIKVSNQKKVKILWDRVFLAAIAVLVVILGLVLIFSESSKEQDVNLDADNTGSTSASDVTDNTSSAESELPQVEDPNQVINEKYDFITKTSDDIREGNLILVNSNHNYTPSEETIAEYKKISDLKSKDFKIPLSDLYMREEAILALNNMTKAFTSATSLFDLRVMSYRISEDSDKPITYDANSEMPTGLSFNFSLWPLEKNGTVRKFDGKDQYSWIEDNAGAYGFILRYPEDKESTTGEEASLSQYRYIGLPHSAYMKYKEIATLEEYIDLLKEKKFEQSQLVVEFNNMIYEIYYIASEGETTEVPVPKEYDYEISGNNSDGFIVTYSYPKPQQP